MKEIKYKSLDFEVKKSVEGYAEEDRVLRFIGSDETPDRDGDVVKLDGWDLDNYKKNPVFLWAHDSSVPPIGKAVNVFKNDGKLVFDIQFPQVNLYPFADLVYNLYKGGFLNATSVGFKPKKAKIRREEEIADGESQGYEVERQELLELSAVPVPCNPSALQTAKSIGKVSESEYSSLMSFVKGDFTDQLGSKTAQIIQKVYDSEKLEADQDKEVTADMEKEATKSNQLKNLSFAVSGNKTLLIDNELNAVLGEVTEQVNELVKMAVESVKKVETLDVATKAGASISKSNKGKLEQAAKLINEVISKGEEQESDSDEDDSKKSEPALQGEEEPTEVSMEGSKSAGEIEFEISDELLKELVANSVKEQLK